jgi:NAD(P)-dependent dehydrogenase (short-subunit alcohol dehydrogenase family)
MTKFGFSSTALEVIEGHDLKNRDFIVTGASSGIGIETVRALAKAGARIVCAVRDVTKGEEVAKELRESTKNPNIEVEKLELDNLTSVREFVKLYLAKKRPLHCLINNAGIMACPLSYTVDGFESQFGTNHMGHFVLTIGLLPALQEGFKTTGKKSRVVNVSSLAHRFSDIVFDDINFKTRDYDKFKSYGQSKTANILFSVALTQLYSEKG